MTDKERRVRDEGDFSVEVGGHLYQFLFYRSSVCTMCSVSTDAGRDICWPGWAVRSLDDKQDDEIGRRVAMRRAISRRPSWTKDDRRAAWQAYFARPNRPGGRKT